MMGWGSYAADAKITISSVGNPNMVRNEKDFEMIIIAQGQKQNFAWVAFALITKIGALLFDKRKLRWTTELGIDSDRYVEIFDSRRPLPPPEGELLARRRTDRVDCGFIFDVSHDVEPFTISRECQCAHDTISFVVNSEVDHRRPPDHTSPLLR
jgi:hypothetical protein